jgi:hypothetical protein
MHPRQRVEVIGFRDLSKPGHATYFCRGRSRLWEELLFIVQGKPRSPGGILKIVKNTRIEALQAANELRDQGMAFVTVIADGRVYTVDEFATSFLDARD